MDKSRLIDYYNRAVSEFNHPDPDKAIFGRAQMTGVSADFEKGDRVGLFGVSAKRAAAEGWEDLKNPEQNFRAAMDLDIASYDTGDLADMYIKTAGITGGQQKKTKFIVELDEAFAEIQNTIQYEQGAPVSVKVPEEEKREQPDGTLEGVEGDENIKDETKRQSALMQNTVVESNFESGSLDKDVQEAMSLLREYVNKAV